ncbi:hypothetical protein [Streptomyces sp. NPDC101393]|uniref:hypothetical protein n=1 Tax=Streptomyces sp. NPDC101393 TaxID=3366141 RepID=UPI00381F3048
MGIESDQLVFDYLSRVGDLAQQRGLPSGSRMRLVAGLRSEIDAQKADTVSGVKRILSRLGTPEAVVTAAGQGDGPASGQPGPSTAPPRAVPLTPRGPEAPDGRADAPEKGGGTGRRGGLGSGLTGGLVSGLMGGLTGKLPSPRDTGKPEEPPAPRTGASPPHLAGPDELGDGDDRPDWWRVDPAPFGPGETVPGFVGGIEIPEMWEQPEGEGPKGKGSKGKGPLSVEKGGVGGPEAAATGPDDADGDDEEDEAARPLPGLLRRTLTRRRAAPVEDVAEPAAEAEAVGPVPLRAWLSPVLGLAVLLLAAGALMGSWIALGAGWVLAYVSRRLTRTEAKFAALGVPGIVVAGLLVWLWGRMDGRWGEPIAQGKLGPELMDGLPGMARVAAVASALFLVWRMRRTAR